MAMRRGNGGRQHLGAVNSFGGKKRGRGWGGGGQLQTKNLERERELARYFHFHCNLWHTWYSLHEMLNGGIEVTFIYYFVLRKYDFWEQWSATPQNRKRTALRSQGGSLAVGSYFQRESPPPPSTGAWTYPRHVSSSRNKLGMCFFQCYFADCPLSDNRTGAREGWLLLCDSVVSLDGMNTTNLHVWQCPALFIYFNEYVRTYMCYCNHIITM